MGFMLTMRRKWRIIRGVFSEFCFMGFIYLFIIVLRIINFILSFFFKAYWFFRDLIIFIKFVINESMCSLCSGKCNINYGMHFLYKSGYSLFVISYVDVFLIFIGVECILSVLNKQEFFSFYLLPLLFLYLGLVGLIFI